MKKLEDAKRDALGHRTGVAYRTDTGGTPALTLTSGDEIVRATAQFLVHAEQRLAEANSARIVVVDKNARLVGHRHGLPHAGEVRLFALFSAANRYADVVAITHQQELSDLAHRK